MAISVDSSDKSTPRRKSGTKDVITLSNPDAYNTTRVAVHLDGKPADKGGRVVFYDIGGRMDRIAEDGSEIKGAPPESIKVEGDAARYILDHQRGALEAMGVKIKIGA